MKTNPENIPAHIFDWLQQYRFESLDTARQKEVLQYLDAAAYNVLHEASETVRMKTVVPASGKMEKKKQLMDRFDAHHRENKKPVFLLQRPVALWKAAAIVVVALTGWVFFYLNVKKEKTDAFVAQVDTVYVTKEVPAEPLKIHDTVYVTKFAKENRKKDTVRRTYNVPVANGGLSVSETERSGVVPFNALETIPNRFKRNSMKDDTLLKKYSFVTL